MTKTFVSARKIVAYGTVPLAVLLAGGFVWQGSQAAFTDTTRNSGNSWASGSVVLTDDDMGQAGFHATGILPGDTGTRCIVVTSNSTTAGEVRSYVENMASGQSMANHIMIGVEPGSGGSFNDCTGFTADASGAIPLTSLGVLAGNDFDYATGGTSWATTGTAGEQKSYRITWKFDTTGLTQAQIDAMQGGQVTADMVWEIQTP